MDQTGRDWSLSPKDRGGGSRLVEADRRLDRFAFVGSACPAASDPVPGPGDASRARYLKRDLWKLKCFWPEAAVVEFERFQNWTG